MELILLIFIAICVGTDISLRLYHKYETWRIIRSARLEPTMDDSLLRGLGPVQQAVTKTLVMTPLQLKMGERAVVRIDSVPVPFLIERILIPREVAQHLRVLDIKVHGKSQFGGQPEGDGVPVEFLLGEGVETHFDTLQVGMSFELVLRSDADVTFTGGLLVKVPASAGCC